MKRSLVARDARTLARIINLAERCRCTCTLFSAEHDGDVCSYHVNIEVQGSEDALRLLDSQLDRILAYEGEVFA
jgi:hypothetical protein